MSTVVVGAMAATLSVVVTAAITLYRGRKTGPETQATLVGASDLLLTQMANRIEALENRVLRLELENDEYHRLYGPLPTTPGEAP